MESLLNKNKNGGFTLIELLIVVAIIGVLAAVGIPAYQGYITDSKIKASTENHTRVNDFLAASLTQCATGVDVNLPGGATPLVVCSTATKISAGNWVGYMPSYFEAAGFKNPHQTAVGAVKGACATGPAGQTCIQAVGNKIWIRTFPGDVDGNPGVQLEHQLQVE